MLFWHNQLKKPAGRNIDELREWMHSLVTSLTGIVIHACRITKCLRVYNHYHQQTWLQAPYWSQCPFVQSKIVCALDTCTFYAGV